MSKYLWIRGKRYYFWGNYNTWKDAYNEARYHCRKNRKNRYFIQTADAGFLYPRKVHKLYMSKVFKIW
jgi:hypothetical protein